MEKERKKALQMQYKNYKPDMGVYLFYVKESGIGYLGCTHDLKSVLNRHVFTLNLGSHLCKSLQEEWKRYGSEGIEIQILEKLEYEKDSEKTDYNEELEILLTIWQEKLEMTVRIL